MPVADEPPRPRAGVSALTGELLRHGFIAVTEEMKRNLMRTAYNMIIYEALDFTVGLFDAEGRTISIGLGLPMFIRGLSETVKAMITEFGIAGMAPGDIYVTNDAYTTGSHLNHVTLVLPLFAEGEIVGFTATMAHWQDIGGSINGVTTDIFSEGLQIPIMRLYAQGELNEDLIKIIRANVRLPDLALGDLRAEVAAVRTGERRVADLVGRYGPESFVGAMDFIQERSAARARAAVARMPDGVYSAGAFMDDDGVSVDAIPIRVRVVIDGERMTIDLSDLAGQVQGFYNSGKTAGHSAAQVAFTCLVDPLSRPINDGTFAPLEVTLPPGTVVSAVKPAAMRWWMTIPMTVVDTIFRALAPALPDEVAAGHHADLVIVNMNGIDPRTKRFFSSSGGLIGGGWGAKRREDGVSATIAINDGDTHSAPVESTEIKFPQRIVRQQLRQDSGGAGRTRGGLGVIQEREMLGPVRINAQIERTKYPPWGLFGGLPGLANRIEVRHLDGSLEQFPTAKVLNRTLEAGETFVLYSGGGGGYGDPLERPAEAVAEDVRLGYLSLEAAARDYGVVVDRARQTVDVEATRRLGRAGGATVPGADATSEMRSAEGG